MIELTTSSEEDWREIYEIDMNDINDINKPNDNSQTTIQKEKHKLEILQKFKKVIIEKKNDQDFNQKINVLTSILLEIYRVFIGSFLIIFVPLKCENTKICSLSQNINRNDYITQLGLVINTLTIISFFVLYFFEIKRENKLITYLEVNSYSPNDNESVGKALEKLSIDKKSIILAYDWYYQKSGNLTTIVFLINIIISSIVIYNYYYDDKTITVFLTNLLFMGIKIVDVFSTVNSKQNIFYSAYLKNKVQFNDVDPNKIQINNADNELQII